jgi:hypothetical protein
MAALAGSCAARTKAVWELNWLTGAAVPKFQTTAAMVLLPAMRNGAEIEGFVAPVLEIGERGAGADALAVDVELEAIVGADVDEEVRGNGGEGEGFAEVEDVLVAGRAGGRGDPLSVPGGGGGLGGELAGELGFQRHGRGGEAEQKDGEGGTDGHGWVSPDAR